MLFLKANPISQMFALKKKKNNRRNRNQESLPRMILLQNKKTLESISCGFDLIGLPVVVMQRLLVEHTGIYQCETSP